MGLVVAREAPLPLIFTYRESWLRWYSIMSSLPDSTSASMRPQGRLTEKDVIDAGKLAVRAERISRWNDDVCADDAWQIVRVPFWPEAPRLAAYAPLPRSSEKARYGAKWVR